MITAQEIDMWRDYYVSNKEQQDKTIKVAFYARVSTEHDAQMQALENQESWCFDLLRIHPNWKMIDMYVDKGITGTQAKRRSGFMKAIEDGKNKRYDLLVVRDVSRFARNCEESLRYTHLLKRYSVEVYFYTDNIWSLDSDGDLRLGLMSILAQDESRRISEKVLAGQHISRQKGVIYGNGNILGYRLIRGRTSSENTYEIVEEEADTIRMIFDLYVNKGLGMKKIASLLIKNHRKNASGIVKWDVGKVTRILDNRTYAGFLGYKKSRCINFLEHKRVTTDKKEHIYVKGKFAEIISDEIWQKAQTIKDKRTVILRNGMKKGKKSSGDRWVRVLKCSCGKSYRKYRWRVNQTTGEEVYGYQCNNQVRNRKRSYIVNQGLDGTGYCDVPSIAMWKLDFQLKRILNYLWENPSNTVEELIKNIEKNYVREEDNKNEIALYRLKKEKERLEIRIKNLIEMRIEGDIDKDNFLQKKSEMEDRIENINHELDSNKSSEDDYQSDVNKINDTLNQISVYLQAVSNVKDKFVNEDLVDGLVYKVVPYENGIFKWYLNFKQDDFNNYEDTEFLNLLKFNITFNEAKEYRKRFGNFIRARQWNDIQVEVYVRV